MTERYSDFVANLLPLHSFPQILWQKPVLFKKTNKNKHIEGFAWLNNALQRRTNSKRLARFNSTNKYPFLFLCSPLEEGKIQQKLQHTYMHTYKQKFIKVPASTKQLVHACCASLPWQILLISKVEPTMVGGLFDPLSSKPLGKKK